jgi:hypothetical protein
VGRVDPLGQLQLALEAGQVLGILGVRLAQQLERDDLPGLLVAGLPDDAHAAAAQFGEQGEALGHGSLVRCVVVDMVRRPGRGRPR